jgi:hypothetical protein
MVFAACCPAQDPLTLAFAKQVQADVALLVSHQSIGEWQKGHPDEMVEPADYKPDNQWPEADFSSLPSRCAVSVEREPPEATRSALFVVPPVTPGKLPPLPTTANPALMQSCRIEEMWVETHSPVSTDSLIRVLASSWGEPNGPSQPFHDAIFFARFRKDLPIWHRAGMTVWVVNRIGPNSPVAVYARNDIPAEKDWYDVVNRLQAKVAEQSAPTLARIAALDPVLTRAILARTSCATGPPAQEDSQLTAERLERWLNASKSLTSSRRAAALLIADYYMSCSAGAPQTIELKDRYLRMGADFFGGCPQEPEYGHNFRKQAEEIDGPGIAGEFAALAGFWEKCSIAYGNIIQIGERLARRFPEWRPYIRYALARSHEAALSRDYPGGAPEEGLFGPPAKVDPGKIERERIAAIRDFTSFIREKPADSESTFAWQEVWRLQAGLKPTRVSFGCSCE